MKRWIKIVSIILFCFFLILITAAFTLPYLINLDRYRGMIETKLEQIIARKVSLGKLRITILPTLGAKIEDVVISNPPGFSSTPFLSLQALKVRVKLLPLLVGKKEITGLSFHHPKIVVERDKGGTLNIPLMEKNKTKVLRKPSKGGTGKQEESTILQGFYLSTTSITGGSFIYLDKSIMPERRIQIDTIDLNVSDLSLEQRVRYDLSVKWAHGDLLVEGWLGPLGKTLDLRKLPMEGRLRARFPSLGALMRDLTGTSEIVLEGSSEGNLSFAGNVGSTLKVQGEIDMKVPSLQKEGERIIQNLNLLLRPTATMSWSKGEVKLNSIVQLEKTILQMEGEFKNLHNKPSGTLTFSSKKGIDLDKLGHTFPLLQKEATLKGDLALSGNLRISPKNAPFLSLEADSSKIEIRLVKKPKEKKEGDSQKKRTKKEKKTTEHTRFDMRGSLRVKDGTFQGVDVQDLLLVAEMRGDTIKIEKFSFKAFGGKMDGLGELERGKEPHPFQMSTQVTKVDTSALLHELFSMKEMIRGNLYGNISLKGEGLSIASLKKDLTGKGTVKISHGELPWLNIINQIVQGLGSKEWGKEKTRFENLSTSFTIQQGQISLPDILISNKDTEIKLRGDVGLNLQMRMEGEAHLPSSATKSLAGKEWVYLKDERGRLTIPFTLNGEFRNPRVGISTKLIERGLEGVLKELFQKKRR